MTPHVTAQMSFSRARGQPGKPGTKLALPAAICDAPRSKSLR
jgi:hypothetical protein